MPILLSIDVTLLEKARFKNVTRRNGKKAVFADLILIESPGSEFGDYIVKQCVSKEERNTVKLPILGNGKNSTSMRGGTSAKHTNPNDGPAEPSVADEDDTQLPF